MKGTLSKTENGWEIRYWDIDPYYKGGPGDIRQIVKELSLHPDDVNQIIEDSKVFDNIEARIKAYPDVEFKIKKDCPFHFTSRCTMDRCDCKEYAKLID